MANELSFEFLESFMPPVDRDERIERAYAKVGNDIYEVVSRHNPLKLDKPVQMMLAAYMTGYLRDVVSDGGLWRTFINSCHETYGRWLPFYDVDDQYIEYELNQEDVRFMTWYLVAMLNRSSSNISPDDRMLTNLADKIFRIMDKYYLDLPETPGYRDMFDLEPDEPDYLDRLFDLVYWLITKSFLISPEITHSRAGECMEIIKLANQSDAKSHEECSKQLSLLSQQPIGPLALNVAEWLDLLGKGGKALKCSEYLEEDGEPLKRYGLFMQATDGRPLYFAKDYAELNRFMIEHLDFEPGVEHLEQLKDAVDFTIRFDKTKGLQIVPYSAYYIKCDYNPLYNKKEAQQYSINALTELYVCPHDLRLFLLSHNMLADVSFDGGKSHNMVVENADFIQRVFLTLDYWGE